jgi:ubiquitin C-terminal hydrolase
MNSVLQSLSFTSLLTNYVLSDEYAKNMNLNNLSVPQGIVANEYLNLIFLLRCGQYSNLTPAPFKQIIGHVQHSYLGNHQQDAHEFLIFLLDYLHGDQNNVRIIILIMKENIFVYSIRQKRLKY